MDPVSAIILTIIAVIFSGIFSGVEIAFVQSSKVRIGNPFFRFRANIFRPRRAKKDTENSGVVLIGMTPIDSCV